MSNETTVRSRIHGLWESFFPSTVYFSLFVAIALFSFGFEHVAQLSREGYFDDYANNKLFLFLKELEVLKLMPVAVLFMLAFFIYVFDRIAMLVGNAVPPFPVWHGSSALYVEKHYLQDLWSLLPDEQNVAALDYQARCIVEKMTLDEKKLPSNSFVWLNERQNKAGRMLAYAKAGFIWSVIVFVVAILGGFFSLRSTAIFVAGVVGFVMLFLFGIVAQTNLLIATSQEHIRVAATLLRLQQKSLERNSSRMNEFDKALENSIRYARRFVGLDWRPRIRASGLRNAFFGFTNPTSTSPRSRTKRRT